MHASTDAPFLFIAGVPKAGTTSLFAHLAAHPRIAPAWIKEPGYFVPPDCHLQQPMTFGTTPFETYLEQFAVEPARDAEPIRLDGSTLYFTYPGTPERIRAIVPNARAIVSLREPVARLESCYKMARSARWIPGTMTFDAYVSAMLNWTPAHGGDNYLFEEGRYSGRLRCWREVFEDRLLVVWLDDIVRDPRETMRRICAFAGIDAEFYDNYPFRAENVSRERFGLGARRLYGRIEAALQTTLENRPTLRRRLSSIWAPFARRFDAALTRPVPRPALDPQLRQRVFEYFLQDLDALAAVVGRDPPWAEEYRQRRIR